MHRDRVGKLQVLQLSERIFHRPGVVKTHSHRRAARVNLFDPAEITIKNTHAPIDGHVEISAFFPLHIVIVAGLHNLVPLAENGLLPHIFAL